MRISNAYLSFNLLTTECYLDNKQVDYMLYYSLHAHANTNLNKRKGQK
jgi:hypothetical protein